MATDAPPLTDKQFAAEALARMPEFAAEALARMPEAATLAEIGEQLAILAGIARGQRDADAGRTLPHAEAERRSRSWTSR